jgi:hypothetical protein
MLCDVCCANFASGFLSSDFRANFGGNGSSRPAHPYPEAPKVRTGRAGAAHPHLGGANVPRSTDQPVTLNAEIGPDTPLRLGVAVKLAFPAGGMDVAGFRKERDRGNLAVEKIAGKEFTTLRNIEEMREKCRVKRGQLDCDLGPTPTPKTGKSGGAQPGSSATDHTSSARAALVRNVNARKKNSANTSPANTSRPESANVIPLKSQ